MITLAMDTATDRCTVAVGDGERTAHAFIDGSRRHAAAIVGLLDQVLAELRANSADIGRILLADGPGSFTGLRVAASVARALTWQRTVEWMVAPSLMVRAAAFWCRRGAVWLHRRKRRASRGTVCRLLAFYAGISDASRPRAARHDAPKHSRISGQSMPWSVRFPEALIARVAAAAGCAPIVGEAALPDARRLLTLAQIRGAMVPRPGIR